MSMGNVPIQVERSKRTMISRKELLSNPELVKQKAVGCLVGLAIGDALGDLGRTQEYRQKYGIVTDLYDGAQSTDDTEFGLLTAKTLLENDGVLTRENVLASWKKYILEQGGVNDRGGRPLYGATANIARGMTPPLSGRDNVMNNDDGAAMRIAPIGIINAGDPKKAATMAEIEAEISHFEDGIWAAQAVAASIAVAMVDGTTYEIINAGLKFIPEDSWLGRNMACMQAIWEENQEIESCWEQIHSDFWTPAHSVAPEAIPQTYAIIHYTKTDLTKGLFWSANFGRDADTITAIVGAVSGARHGITTIPDVWKEQVRKPAGVCLHFTRSEDIVRLAEQLAGLMLA